MNPYELILIFDPNLGEEKTGNLLTKIEDKIKHLGGEIDKIEKWGVRRLASIIKKAKSLTQGYYVLVRFKSAPSVPAELRSFLKVSENIVRYFVSREVIAEEGHVRKEVVGAPAEAVEVGEIKGKPLGEPQ